MTTIGRKYFSKLLIIRVPSCGCNLATFNHINRHYEYTSRGTYPLMKPCPFLQIVAVKWTLGSRLLN